MTEIQYDVREDCKGPNARCWAAHKAGRTVHVIEATWKFPRDLEHRSIVPALVMPSCHYATAEEGIAALKEARTYAVMIQTDADLYAAREAGVPHLLPVRWIDPSRR
jgi:hypothetical protein